MNWFKELKADLREIRINIGEIKTKESFMEKVKRFNAFWRR